MAQKRFSIENIRRGLHYVKRNGWREAFFKAKERLIRDEQEQGYEDFFLREYPSKEELIRQRKESANWPFKISILVPAYETPECFLTEMLKSVDEQSFENWELCVADASQSDKVERTLKRFLGKRKEKRIRFYPLKENKGISENTNYALKMASGDYISLLDHDDCLRPDALYEVGRKILQGAYAVYTDEDKIDTKGKRHFDYHKKPDLNLDLLRSNNYICHLFTVNRQIAIDAGSFVSEYNGAQDYDFILRCIETIGEKGGKVEHVPKVLYHWRSHSLSTAEHPESKMYAYEAGKKVLEAHLKRMGLHGKVSHGKHLGFYRIDYEEKEGEEGIFLVKPSCKPLSKGWEKEVKGYFSRPEVGAVGGKICDEKNRIQCAGYEKDENGIIQAPFRGMDRRFSGYLHRAAIQRDVEAVDMDCIIIRKELWEKLKESFQEREKNHIEASYALCEKIRNAGYLIVYHPYAEFRRKESWTKTWRK